MSFAIIISGNLRTFFMPIAGEDSLAQLFYKHIVNANNADVFAFTDTNDFYLDGTQYFATDKRIEILNKDTSRLHNKVGFIDSGNAKKLITDKLGGLLGSHLKSMIVEDPYNPANDSRFDELMAANIKGNNPALLIHQTRKTKLAYDLMQKHEHDVGKKYDVVLRWRFDNTVNGDFNFAEYDFCTCDVYVPGIHSPVIYDWFALGTREPMTNWFTLYDRIGTFLKDGRMYICSKCQYHGSDNSHNCVQNCELYEITLSVEYHIFRVSKDNNIRLGNARYQSCPQRYRVPASSFDAVMDQINIDATVVSYSPGTEVYETKYQKK